MDYRLLLDAPGEPRSRIQIAALGDFTHPRYGDFSITAKDVADWQANLEHLPGKRALIDLDHRADRQPRTTEAAGWITSIDLTDGKPMADVEWTPVGVQAITDKRYLFFSPTYGPFQTEHGEKYANTLQGGALTNKPHLSSLPTVSLAAPERIVQAWEDEENLMLDVGADERKLAVKEGNALPDGSYPIRNTAQLHAAIILARSGHGDVEGAKALIKRRAKELGATDLLSSEWPEASGGKAKPSDSRRSMDQALLTALELDDTADEAKVLEAVTALVEKAKTPPPAEQTKTLEQLAADEKKVVLDSADFAQLRNDATAGAAAAKELHDQKFEVAWQRALEAGRAVPAMEESRRKFYELDADTVIKELDEGPQIVNTRLKPWSNDATNDPKQAPAGVHPDNFELDQAIWAHIKEKGLKGTDYPHIFEQVSIGELTL